MRLMIFDVAIAMRRVIFRITLLLIPQHAVAEVDISFYFAMPSAFDADALLEPRRCRLRCHA